MNHLDSILLKQKQFEEIPIYSKENQFAPLMKNMYFQVYQPRELKNREHS
jgi:hypothetical protein